MVVDWTVESGWPESTVISVKAKWTISLERERTLSPAELSLRWEWFDIKRFPPSNKLTNGGRGNQVTKNEKKQTQRRQRRHLLCVDAIAFDAAYSPFFRSCFGIRKNAAASSRTWHFVPGPLASRISTQRNHFRGQSSRRDVFGHTGCWSIAKCSHSSWISKLTALHLQILHQEIFWSPW